MKNNKGQQVGYIRVSTTTQNTDRQLDGIELDKTFTEKKSAKTADERKELRACIEYLRVGDMLHIHSIDRLARNLADLKTLVTQINAKGAAVNFHKENLIFKGDGASDPMQQLMLNMMGAFAEFERSIIVERRREGVAIALEKGVKFGRTAKVTPEIALEIQTKKAAGVKITELMEQYKIGRRTVYDALKKVVK
jgi:DNA invertase Pin-like site-specific DNA recombinase